MDLAQPRFSWRLADHRAGAGQSGYRVQVSRAVFESFDESQMVWDSGRVDSSASNWITYDGKPIEPMTRYAWRVRSWDENGLAGAWSAAQWFETGRMGKLWSARWIAGSAEGPTLQSGPSALLRRAFQLEANPQWARLYVTALGLYECRLNGRRVGDGELRPGWTDYSKRVVYDTYDVTHLLGAGENVVGAMLGDGWYCGRIAWFGRQNYGDRPKLLAELHVRLADGTERIICTDDLWLASTGPVQASDLLDGERYDATLDIRGWDRTGFEVDGWRLVDLLDGPTNMEIAAPIASPVRVMQRISANEVASPDPGVRVYDLEQNIAGRVRIRLRGERGVTVRLRHAEMLQQDGNLYTENLRSAAATDWYTLQGGGEETYEPRFTFHGFRYVEVMVPQGQSIEVLGVEGNVLHNDMPMTGSFACSDALVNQLFSNLQWGQRDNYLEVPTDCPQRDERLGWTGDAQVFIPTACYNMDVAAFMAKWLQDLRDGQGEDGRYPKYAPDPNGPGVDGGPAWSEAGVICAWQMWLHYADRRLLEDHYESMRRFATFLNQTTENGIRPVEREGVRMGYGDWLALDSPEGERSGATPLTLIGTAYHVRTVDLLAKIAETLEAPKDAESYRGRANQLRAAFQRQFVGEDAKLDGHTQTAYLLALGFDLLPERLRPAALSHLVACLADHDNHISTGFVGTHLLCPVLTRFGRVDLAYRLLMTRTFPGWLYSVLQGATTMWERWDGYTQDGGFGPASMNSFNHYAYGAIGQWLYETVLGIAPTESHPGFKRFHARPIPGGGLTHASGHVDTMHGRIEAGWHIEDSVFRYELTVPPNTSAELTMPFPAKPIQASGARQDARGRWRLELASGRHSCSQAVPSLEGPSRPSV
jgi:alpha-L-rhamnosidase